MFAFGGGLIFGEREDRFERDAGGDIYMALAVMAVEGVRAQQGW